MNFVSDAILAIAVIGTVEGNVFSSGTGVAEVSAGLGVAGIDVGSNVRAAEVGIEVAGFTILAFGSLTSCASQAMNNETIMMAASILTDIFSANCILGYSFKIEN